MGSEGYRTSVWQKLLLVGIALAFLFMARWLFSPSDTLSEGQHRERVHFIDAVQLRGKVTNVAVGREVRFWVDSGPATKWPGLVAVDSLEVFSVETDLNVGDSIIKEAGSDRVWIRSADGREHLFKVVL